MPRDVDLTCAFCTDCKMENYISKKTQKKYTWKSRTKDNSVQDDIC